ncbi:efflux RND transporter periplasmic adaptor subunit [Rhabdaerophilum sp. SD176]|uniref:efflux RND transporter periplasmic adaptor subunit n=1 Tax=Rhabdaerophilum sp. SD176 TaxID=2983548 RepID=UPI0024DF7CD4|nr:efflux RND transporter periplasmic adaptor subunit [Rhabdaerophilum sp. SD176]
MTRGRIVLFLLLIGAAGGGYFGWKQWLARQAEAPQTGGRRGGALEGPVAVSASAVRVEDVPLLREGIGNVQANALVTVRAQIEGKLLSVEFREGQMVKAGDILARIDPAAPQAQLDQALAKQAQNQANLANARLDLERYQRLAATNAGPRQQADQQKAVVEQLEAQLRADDAAIASARTSLGYTTITSPIDGRAGLRQVDAGNIIRAGDAAGLVTIAQVQPIAVVFTLPQRDLAVVPEALARGLVPVDVIDADGRSILATGKLDVVDNQVDITTGTIRLKASFANENARLWPGQFVSVRVRVGAMAGARTVPTPALRRGPAGPFVYVIGEGGKVAARPVVTGPQDEERVVIVRGLEPGEHVVTAGFPRLTEGREVTVLPDSSGTEVLPVAPAQRQRGGPGSRQRPTGGRNAAQPGSNQPGSPPPGAPPPGAVPPATRP